MYRIHRGPLYDLILKACPLNSKGVPCIKTLAETIKRTPQTIHRSIKVGIITPDLAARISEQSEVDFQEFLPFFTR